MWNIAEMYLLSSNDVLPASGSYRKSKMVTSRSFRLVSPGHYVCDKNCLQWSSSESNLLTHFGGCGSEWGVGIVFTVVHWHGQEPNITRLAQAGLPAGRG